MAYIYVQTYSGPPATVTIACANDPNNPYVWDGQLTNGSQMPVIINLPSQFDSCGEVSLTAQSENGCVFIDADTCSPVPSPTPSTVPPCYAFAIYTNNTWSAGEEITYIDCYGNEQTYITQAGDENGFQLCAYEIIGGDSGLVYDDSQIPTVDCSEIEGVWYPNNPLPSLSITASLPPTPTPSEAASSNLFEVMVYTAGTRYTAINLDLFPGNNTVHVDWDDGSPIESFSSAGGQTSMVKNHNYSPPYYDTLKVVRISATTTTAGIITSIRNINTLGNGTILGVPSGYLNGYLQTFANTSVLGSSNNQYFSASTTQLAKCVNAQSINLSIVSYTTGSINAFSACTALQSLKLYGGNYTGNIDNLPNTLVGLTMGATLNGQVVREYPLPKVSNYSRWSGGTVDVNTVTGNIANLPTSLQQTVIITGLNTINGDVAGFANQNWNTNSVLHFGGGNTLSGNFSDIPNVSRFTSVYGQYTDNIYSQAYVTNGNTITGTLQLKSAHNEIWIGGVNTISGNLSTTTTPSSPLLLAIQGNNTLSGSIAGAKIPKQFYIAGNNTLSGNLNLIQGGGTAPAQLTDFMVYQRGNAITAYSAITNTNSGNTITGNMSFFLTGINLRHLFFGGNNTVSGAFNNLSATTTLDMCFITSPNNGINMAAVTPPSPGNPNNDLWGNQPWMILDTDGSGMNGASVNNMILYIMLLAPLQVSNNSKPYYTITGTGHAAPTNINGNALTQKNNYNSGSTTGKITTN